MYGHRNNRAASNVLEGVGEMGTISYANWWSLRSSSAKNLKKLYILSNINLVTPSKEIGNV